MQNVLENYKFKISMIVKSKFKIYMIANRFCGIISLRMIPSLVVDQHFDQLIVHDLHVHLKSVNDNIMWSL